MKITHKVTETKKLMTISLAKLFQRKPEKESGTQKIAKKMQMHQDFKLKTQTPLRYHKCGACWDHLKVCKIFI